MPYAHYGMTWSQDDLEKVGHDIINKAKESESENEQQAHMIRLMYVEKIKRVKKKILSEFDRADELTYGEVELLGDEQDPTKDVIMVQFLIEDKSNHKRIFKMIVDFVKEAMRRTKLDKFFIPKNFGTQEFNPNRKIELLFLKQNHSYKRIKNKPFIIPQDEEGEEGFDDFGGGGGGEPLGGLGDEPETGEPAMEPEPEPETGDEG